MSICVRRMTLVVLCCALIAAITSSAQATSATWNGANDANWADPNNWVGKPTPPGTGDTATFNSGSGNVLINLGTGAGVTVSTISFDTAAAAAYIIGSGAVNTQLLTFNDNGGVTMTNTVAANETVNALIRLGTGATAGNYVFTNNSTTNTLILAGGIVGGTGGTGAVKSILFGGTGAGGIVGNITVSGNIAQGGASALDLYDRTSGTLTLSGSSTVRTLYTGGSGIASTTIDIGAGSLFLNNSGATVIQSTSNTTINATGGGVLVLSTSTGTNYGDVRPAAGYTLTLNSRVTSTGGFELNDAGTVILNGINDFAGDVIWTVANGTISVSNIGNAGSTTSNMGKGTNILMNSAGVKLLYTGTGETTNRVINIGANAILDQSGTGGLLKFTANPTNAASARTLTLQGSTPGAGELAGVISDNTTTNTTSIYKTGSGIWTLSGTNTYSGTTTVNAGILSLTNPAALQNSTLVLAGSGAVPVGTLSFDSSVSGNAFAIGGLSGSTGNTLTLQNNAVSPAPVALTVGGTNISSTFAGNLAGPGSVTKAGNGTLTLTGTNTYVGGTTLSGGTININGDQAIGASTAGILFNTNSTLQSGASNFTLNANRNITINPGATATFDITGAGAAVTVAGSITGSGNLTKTSGGILNLAGTNSYLGTTTVTGGTLTYMNTAAKSTGAVTVAAGATLGLGVGGTGYFGVSDVDALFANTLSGVTMNAASLIGIDTSAGDFTYTTSQSGAYLLNKLGNNTLTLTGTNTIKTLYFSGTGTTNNTIDIGTGSLYLSNLGAQTINANASGVINGSGGGVLILSYSGGHADNGVATGQTVTINAKISAMTALGGFEYYGVGAGTFVFTNPLNDYPGDTLFSQTGTIVASSIGNVGVPSALGAGTNINFNAAGAKLVYVGTGDTTNHIININQSAILDQSGTGGLLKFTANPTNGASARTLTLQGSTPGVGEMAGIISDNSSVNTTGILKSGTGTWTLSGSNSYTGATTIYAGVLNLANPWAILNSTLTFAGTGGTGTVSFDSVVGSNAFTIGGLSGGTGSIALQNTASAAVALSAGFNNSSTTYGGNLSGPGSLNKIGLGILSLSGTNSYLGGTTVSAGTLTFLNTAAKTGTTTVASAATLGLGVGGAGYFGSTDVDNLFANTLGGVTMSATSLVGVDTTAGNFTYASSPSGTMGLVKLGTNILALTGNSSYTGGTLIAGGILQLGTGGTAGMISGNVVDNGILAFNRSDASVTFAGLISGTGAVTKSGSGTVVLSAANTFTGATTVSTGSLTLANALALQNSTLSSSGSGIVFSAAAGNAFTIGAISGTGSLVLLNNVGTSSVALTVGGNNASTTYNGNISGTGSLSKIGLGTMTMQGTNSYTGATNIGATAVIQPGTTNYPSSTLVLSGTNGAIGGSNAINIGNGTLTLDSSAGKNANRISDTAVVNTNGNAFVGYTLGTSAISYAETVGTLNLNSGYFQYTGNQTGSGQTAIFTATNLTHGTYAMANFAGTSLGAAGSGQDNRNNIMFTNIGGSASTSGDLGGWATYNGADFAYYDTTRGVIASTSTELAAATLGTSVVNFKLTTGSGTGNLALTVSPTYKSLMIASSPGRTLTATGQTVTLTSGGLSFNGTGAALLGGTLKVGTTGAPLYVSVNGNFSGNTISSNIVDNGGTALVVSGGGNSNILYLSGSNSYAGGTYLSNVVLEVGMDAALGAVSGGITVNGNSRIWAAAAPITIAASRTITLNNNSLLTFDGQTKGNWTVAGKVTGNGGISTGFFSSTISFTNTANDFTGPIGIATYNNSGANSASFASLADSLPGVPNSGFSFGNAGNAGTFIYTGTTNMTFNNRSVDMSGTTGGATLQSDGSGILTFNGAFTASGAGAKTFTLQGGNPGLNAFNSVIVDNSIVNKTSVTKAGTGTWVLGGTANTFTGALTIAQGTLVVPQLMDNNGAVTGGNGAGNIVLGTSGQAYDSTLRYTGTGDYTFANRRINLVGNGGTATIDFTGGANIILNPANLVLGQIGTKTLALSSVGTGNVITAPLADGGSGALGLSFNGTGSKWSLDYANTYTGPTTVGALAALKLNNANAISSSNVGLLSVNGTLDLASQTNLTVGAIGGTASGVIDNLTGAAVPYTITVGNGNASGTTAATIQNTNGVISLVKNGTGQQNLLGSNAWTGTTTINGGVLRGVLPSTNLILGGGAIETAVNFTRQFGSGSNQVQFSGNGGGISNCGTGAISVDFSGASAGSDYLTTWGTSGNALNLGSGQLILNGPAATSGIAFNNSLNLNDTASPVNRTIFVGANTATINGTISDGTVNTDGVTPAGAAGLIKTGTGILVLAGTAPNTYTGDTTIMSMGGYGNAIVMAKPDNVIAIPSSNIYIGTPTTATDATLRAGAENQINPAAIVNFTAGTGNAKLELNNHTTTIAGFVIGSGSYKAIIQNVESGGTGTGTLVVKSDTFNSSFLTNGTSNLFRDQSGKLAVTKDGLSTMTLGGAGVTFTGGLNIQNGTVLLSQASALGSIVNFPSASTGLLQIGTGTNSIGGLATDPAYTSAAVENLPGVNATLNLGSNVNNATYSSVIRDNSVSGSLSLTHNGSGGVQTLAGSANNTFSGGFTNIYGPIALAKTGGAIALPKNATGTVNLGSGTAVNITMLGTGATSTPIFNDQIDTTAVLAFNGAGSKWSYFKLMGNNQTLAGITDSSGGGVIEVVESETGSGNSTLTLNVNDPNGLSYNGYMRDRAGGTNTGVLNIVKNGTGTQIIAGTQITYSGSTAVHNGRLVLNNTLNLVSPVTLDNTGSLEVTNAAGIGGLTIDPAAVTQYVQNVGTGNANLTITQGGTGVINTQTLRNNPAGGTLAFTKAGSGAMFLAATNGTVATYTGGTTVTGGGLYLTNGVTLDTNSNITVNGATAVLDLGGSTQTVTNLGNVTITNGTLQNGTLTYGGTAFNVQGGTISAVLDGTAGLYKTAGSLTLSGTQSNTYTGPTLLTGGSGTTLAKTGGAIAIPGNITVDSTTANTELGIGSATNPGLGQQFGPNSVLSLINNTGGNWAHIKLYGSTQTLAGISSAVGSA